MSILNIASSRIVCRGYDYFKQGNVLSYTQLSDFEYEGEVQGTNKIHYHVFINLEHPKSSFCDCPYANENTICKHMIALFFSVSPDDLEDYEDWEENDYEDEYEDYDEDYYYEHEYDRDETYDIYESDFVKPIFFDELLQNFINGLSEDRLKTILLDELKRNEEYTFKKYLKNKFQDCISDENSVYALLEKMNSNFYDLSHNYDYNNKDYSISLLSESEKNQISNAYITNREIRNKINNMILNPELATYDNYRWIMTLYKNNNSEKAVEKYIEKLTSFLDTLKHYNIKNTIPKSNVLIAIHVLNDYDLEESAKLLIKNCKYEEYVDYILDSTNDCEELYRAFNQNVECEKYINKEYIPKIYFKFWFMLSEKEIYNQYAYYSFLYNKNIRYLLDLKKSSEFDYYINKLINNLKDVIGLERIYLFLNKKEELFKLLFKRENEHRLIANIDNLKDDYNEEILKYLKARFYEVVAMEKSRENYKKATIYVKGMYKLNGGEDIVNELIDELKGSQYSKRTALFDEIDKCMKYNKK